MLCQFVCSCTRSLRSLNLYPSARRTFATGVPDGKYRTSGFAAKYPANSMRFFCTSVFLLVDRQLLNESVLDVSRACVLRDPSSSQPFDQCSFHDGQRLLHLFGLADHICGPVNRL